MIFGVDRENAFRCHQMKLGLSMDYEILSRAPRNPIFFPDAPIIVILRCKYWRNALEINFSDEMNFLLLTENNFWVNVYSFIFGRMIRKTFNCVLYLPSQVPKSWRFFHCLMTKCEFLFYRIMSAILRRIK
jgi:hypothetical protein